MSEIIICFIFFALIVVYCNYRIIRLENKLNENDNLQNRINEITVKALQQYETIAKDLQQRITDLEKIKL